MKVKKKRRTAKERALSGTTRVKWHVRNPGTCRSIAVFTISIPPHLAMACGSFQVDYDVSIPVLDLYEVQKGKPHKIL